MFISCLSCTGKLFQKIHFKYVSWTLEARSQCGQTHALEICRKEMLISQAQTTISISPHVLKRVPNAFWDAFRTRSVRCSERVRSVKLLLHSTVSRAQCRKILAMICKKFYLPYDHLFEEFVLAIVVVCRLRGCSIYYLEYSGF